MDLRPFHEENIRSGCHTVPAALGAAGVRAPSRHGSNRLDPTRTSCGSGSIATSSTVRPTRQGRSPMWTCSTMACRTPAPTVGVGPLHPRRTDRRAAPRRLTNRHRIVWTLRAPPCLPAQGSGGRGDGHAPWSEADAAKRVFDAATSFRRGKLDVLEALGVVATTMRKIVTKPTTKGHFSGSSATSSERPMSATAECARPRTATSNRSGSRRCRPVSSSSPAPHHPSSNG